MTSPNEDPPLDPSLKATPPQEPERVRLSATCELEHADPASYLLGFCRGCAGDMPPELVPALRNVVSDVASGETLDVTPGTGIVSFSWRLFGWLGARVTMVLGVPEAHNVSDMLALCGAAAGTDAAGPAQQAAEAVFPGVPGYDADDDAEFVADEIRGWSAAPVIGGRVVLGFCLATAAGFPPRTIAARVLVSAPREFSTRVLHAAAVAQSRAQGETHDGAPTLAPSIEEGFVNAHRRLRSLKGGAP
jgi:hypothetical protein